MRSVICVAVVAAIIAFVVGPVRAQTSGSGAPLVTHTYSLSAAGASPVLALTSGQSVCSVVVGGTFSGLTMRAQAASDGPQAPATWNSVSAVDGGGITSTGTYVGSISASGLTNFRVLVTAIGSGSVTGTIACSSASGSGQAVTIANSPAPTFTPTTTNIGANAGQAVIGYNYGYNKTTSHYDSFLLDLNDVAEVTTGGTHVFRLSSASTTGCNSLAVGTGRLVELYNAGPATTVYLSLFDEGTGETCSSTATDLVYGDGATITLPVAASSVLTLNVPLFNGLAYKLSGALTSPDQIVIVTTGFGY